MTEKPASKNTASGRSPRRRPRSYRQLLRATHAYLTVFAFGLLFFFGLTGFTLNHSDWFDLSDTDTEELTGQVDPALCQGPTQEAVLAALLPVLREDYDLRAPIESVDRDDAELRLLFRQAGRSDDVTIDLDSGDLLISTERSGLLGTLTDVHRGESAGRLSGLLVDAASLLLLATALTGLLLGATMSSRRRLGAAALAAGGVGLALALWALMG